MRRDWHDGGAGTPHRTARASLRLLEDMTMTSRLRVGLAFAALVSLPALPAPAQDPSPPDPATHGFVLIPERPSLAFVDATATHMPAAPSLHATDSVLIDVDGDGDLDAVVSV